MISKNGTYTFSIDNDYIRTASCRFDLTDDQCYEVAQYVEDNIFDYIADVVDELDFEEDEEE